MDYIEAYSDTGVSQYLIVKDEQNQHCVLNIKTRLHTDIKVFQKEVFNTYRGGSFSQAPTITGIGLFATPTDGDLFVENSELFYCLFGHRVLNLTKMRIENLREKKVLKLVTAKLHVKEMKK